MKHPIEKAAEVAGSEKALADHLGVTKAAVWQWKQPGRRTPIEHCAAIERICGHAVTRRELRPDDWQAIWPELAQADGLTASGFVAGRTPGLVPSARDRTTNAANTANTQRAAHTAAMRADEMPAFKDLLTDAMAYYGKDCSAFTLTVWWGALQGCELEQVGTALQRHAMDPERGQFAPKVADLVRVLQGTSTDRAALAWGKVHEAMSAVGAYRDVVFDDPAIHAVVEDLGGWPKVCRTETRELSYLQHRFQEAHRAYTARGQCDYQRRLAGDRSPDHEYSSLGIPLPRPALVGDPQRAIAVIQHGSAAGKTRISTLPAQAMRLLAGASLQEVRA